MSLAVVEAVVLAEFHAVAGEFPGRAAGQTAGIAVSAFAKHLPGANDLPAGVMQATEAVKYIVGAGDLLTDALLSCDVLTMTFRKLKVRRDGACPLCGRNPTLTAPEKPA